MNCVRCGQALGAEARSCSCGTQVRVRLLGDVVRQIEFGGKARARRVFQNGKLRTR